MMLTGAYEGFIVACHRHRDQAHGNCSGFRWEGKKKVVSVHLVILLGDKREREGREETYPFLPFYRLVDHHRSCWHRMRLKEDFRLQIKSCDVAYYRLNRMIMRKLILLILNFGVI